MLEHLRRALDLAARYDYEYWLAARRRAATPQLFAAARGGASCCPPTCASSSRPRRRAVARPPRRARAAAAVAAAQAPLADLTINMLGAVEIFRDPARPFAADAWVTKRARDILCFIASRRHRRASKDTIIDTFWGEADFAAVEKNFHPTISHIRKALNSNQPLKQNFLLYRDGDYQLNPEFSYRIDMEEFDRLVAEGEAARRAREPRLPSRLTRRPSRSTAASSCRAATTSGSRSSAPTTASSTCACSKSSRGAAQKAEDWARALRLAQRILREDPFREDVHCMVMRAHAAQGNRVAVREQYETLEQAARARSWASSRRRRRRGSYRELLG